MATQVPAFLKLLTSAKSLSMSQAIQVASKLLPAKVTTLDGIKQLLEAEADDSDPLEKLGLQDPEIKKGLLVLVKGKVKAPKEGREAFRKRRRDVDLEEPLPSPKKEKPAEALVWDELTDEEEIGKASIVINRAPCMCAWALVVAERLKFSRSEALSLAQAYTEENAKSKGAAIGIYPSSVNDKDGSSQPHVELMGRRVTVLQVQGGEWRAITNGEMVEPVKALSYIRRAFGDSMPAIMGAMRLLAESFSPDELNDKGFGLYAEFRPQSDGWGKRAAMNASTILALRRHLTHKAASDVPPAAPAEEQEIDFDRLLDDDDFDFAAVEDVPQQAKQRSPGEKVMSSS